MAELEERFFVEKMNSRQLLALLFLCEGRRKNTLTNWSIRAGAKPSGWEEFVGRFAARLNRLPESERAYLIGSHLQSAEEIDLYSNDALHKLLCEAHELLEALTRELEADPRFAST